MWFVQKVNLLLTWCTWPGILSAKALENDAGPSIIAMNSWYRYWESLFKDFMKWSGRDFAHSRSPSKTGGGSKSTMACKSRPSFRSCPMGPSYEGLLVGRPSRWRKYFWKIFSRACRRQKIKVSSLPSFLSNLPDAPSGMKKRDIN